MRARELMIAVAVALPLIQGIHGSAPIRAGDGGGEAASEPVDHVALAARLVQDGHYGRASAALRHVDPSAQGVDTGLYWVLRGLVALRGERHRQAAESFTRAVGAGDTRPLVYMNLARARFGMKRYRGVLAALERAGAAARARPQTELIASRAHWELGEPARALEVLARAGDRFPGILEFPRSEIAYLIELELYREVARRSDELLRRSDIRARDLAALGEALGQSGDTDAARRLLEKARLRFPRSTHLTVQLSRVLMAQGEALSSAMLLEQAARTDHTYLVEAAELYRRAGRLERALLVNARVRDQSKKMKQRLQIFLELERYEMIAAMEARLSRLGLLADDPIRYALAYGYFEIRDLESARRHLEQLATPAFFRKGAELRQAIERCEAEDWLCR